MTEILLILGAFIMWLGAMAMFCRTYSKNCLNANREYRFEHEPKNIKSVRVSMQTVRYRQKNKQTGYSDSQVLPSDSQMVAGRQTERKKLKVISSTVR